jgi:hypothetical protein
MQHRLVFTLASQTTRHDFTKGSCLRVPAVREDVESASGTGRSRCSVANGQSVPMNEPAHAGARFAQGRGEGGAWLR